MAKQIWRKIDCLYQDGGVLPVADGTVTVRLGGTTTLAAVYTDYALTQVVSGSVISFNSSGYLAISNAKVDLYVADNVTIDLLIQATGYNGSAAITQANVAVADTAATAEDYRTGFKNAVSNGDFSSWSGSTSGTNASGDDDGDETADGWYLAQPSAASNEWSRQDGAGTGARYGFRFGRAAAATSTNKIRLWKTLATEEVYRLRGQTVVFSFSIKEGANFSGTAVTAKLATGTTAGEDGDGIEAGSWGGFSAAVNQNVDSSTTITRYSYSATIGATVKEAGVQFSYTGSGTAGVNDWIQIEDVQVEIADAVSSFEAPPETISFLLNKISSVARTLVMQTTQALMRTTGLGMSSGASSLVADTLFSVGVFQGELFGMTMANNASDATNDIDFATGRCADSSGSALILCSAMTKKLDATWAVGSAAGGLDAGSIANATYHAHAIKKDSDSSGDFIYSLSHDSDATVTMTLASPCVVTMTGHGLVAGSPFKFSTTGALPTGVAAGTQYYVIATGLATDTFQFSTSIGGAAVNSSVSQSGVHTCLPGPVMPSGYTYFRRIGSIVRSGAAIRAFTQADDEFLWTASPIQDMGGDPANDNAATLTISVPAGIVVTAILQHNIQDTTPGAVTTALLSSLAVTDVAPSGVRHNGFIYGTAAMAAIPNGSITEVRVRTNTSAQIRRRVTGRTADHIQIVNTVGYIDSRGRFA